MSKINIINPSAYEIEMITKRYLMPVTGTYATVK